MQILLPVGSMPNPQNRAAPWGQVASERPQNEERPPEGGRSNVYQFRLISEV